MGFKVEPDGSPHCARLERRDGWLMGFVRFKPIPKPVTTPVRWEWDGSYAPPYYIMFMGTLYMRTAARTKGGWPIYRG